MRRFARIGALGLILAVTADAGAATQTILGKSLLVKDPQPGINPALRKVVSLGKELVSPNVLIGDPIANGASIQIVANGGTPTTQTFVLPAGAALPGGPGWKALGSQPLGYQYKDAVGLNGPVKVAIIKKTASGTFLVKAVIMGALGPGPQPHVTVVPPNLGTDGGMIFTVNGGDSYCVTFGGAAGGKLVNDVGKVFKVTATADLPTSETGCPVPPAPTTTSTSTTCTCITTTTTIGFATHVQPIFTTRCATATCHTGPFPAGPNLNLSAGNAYANLNPGVRLSGEPPCTTTKLVDPGSPATSYLISKMQTSPAGCFVGSPMPASVAVPLQTLAPSEYATIFAWVAAGAPNN